MLPIVIAALSLAHLIFLHKSGSSNPTGTNPNIEKIKFFPYYLTKDITPLLVISIIIRIIISSCPDILRDPENFNISIVTVTPTHIKPEWYFLFAYGILRCIPSKLGGVLAMIMSIIILIVLIFKKKNINKKFLPIKKILF
jgi:ubiquinol-cytochrome c reductase cytochrome b subunit